MSIAENLIRLIKTLTGNDILAVVILSMTPFIEVRGAIPFALGLGLSPFDAWLFCAMSATLAVPPILLLFSPVVALLKKLPILNGLICALEEVIGEKCQKIIGRAESRRKKRGPSRRKKAFVNPGNASGGDDIYTAKSPDAVKYRLLFFLAAAPIPLTGIWSSGIIAAFLGLDKIKAFTAIALGNLVSSAIVALLMRFFIKQMPLILNAVIASVLCVSIYTIGKIILKSLTRDKKAD
ncbi:MAG: small multi-drug export protein [Clostridiales bacterium]|jgi:uncharacterized membrane protein|nr:small multi-drug export protein [Clostridiales bacterium]